MRSRTSFDSSSLLSIGTAAGVVIDISLFVLFIKNDKFRGWVVNSFSALINMLFRSRDD